jgi:hypothetical protein
MTKTIALAAATVAYSTIATAQLSDSEQTLSYSIQGYERVLRDVDSADRLYDGRGCADSLDGFKQTASVASVPGSRMGNVCAAYSQVQQLCSMAVNDVCGTIDLSTGVASRPSLAVCTRVVGAMRAFFLNRDKCR